MVYSRVIHYFQRVFLVFSRVCMLGGNIRRPGPSLVNVWDGQPYIPGTSRRGTWWWHSASSSASDQVLFWHGRSCYFTTHDLQQYSPMPVPLYATTKVCQKSSLVVFLCLSSHKSFQLSYIPFSLFSEREPKNDEWMNGSFWSLW